MPTNLYPITGLSRKSSKLTCFFLFLPLFFFGQSLTGLYIGSVSNDSTTVRKDQSFEIALTEYKGKVYGYSRSEFIVDDVLYYIVKRVSGTIVGDVCEVTDDEIISYNFPELLDKKVKVTSTFRRDKSDSVWYLAGKWKTNVTKKYYSVSGRVDLEEEKDLTASKIFPHLEELKLADAVAFYKERKEGQPIVKIAKPEKASSGISTAIMPLTTNSDAIVVADKPIVAKNNSSAVANPSTTAATESTKEQPSSEKTTTAIEELATNTELTAVKKADNTQTTGTKSIPSTKVEATPSSKTIALQTQPAANDKNKDVTTEQVKNNNTSPDLTFAPVVEKKEVASAASKNTEVKTAGNNQELVKNNDPAAQQAQNITETKANNTVASKTADKKENTTTAKQDVAITTKPVEKAETTNNPSPAVKTNNAGTVKTNTIPANDKKENTSVPKQDVAATTKPVAKTETPTTTTAVVKNNASPGTGVVKTNTDKKENVTTAKQDVAVNAKTDGSNISENKIVKADAPITPLKPEIKTASIDITLKAAIIAGRKSEFSQQVNFKSDSLQVSLYDNGEIDGDTVSVFMNGEVIMAKQGLKSSAIRKTIYLTPGQEEFTLVLFAENLGKYPPNTGLLVVRDGDDVYNLRFSSDFEKNTGIVFRRKK